MNKFERILSLFNKLPCDKARHFFYGSLLVFALFPIFFVLTNRVISEALWYTTIAIMFIAALKEGYDSLYPDEHEVEFLDFFFTILPSLLLTVGVSITISINH